ncbi:uncharacterized protein LOC111601541 isoform X1 [Drosophila hydei]|uniref:Beta-sarcoglycan n=2 Tax=Drosophila hydei TaxID=7224 RepID=A0A6J1M6G2_DROHY|nr:uncharacterized protein LOC111601541 isoform X1 [Drosophila hydei]
MTTKFVIDVSTQCDQQIQQLRCIQLGEKHFRKILKRKMDIFENTFVRGPSPSYSDEANSETGLSVTLPIEAADMELDRNDSKSDTVNFFDEKFNSDYDDDSFSHLHPGRQMRKSYAFWTAVVVLLMLTIGNLILTLTIMGVLRLGKGVKGMEMIPEVDLIKFYDETDLDRIQTNSIGIHGFSDVPVSITSDGDYSGVHLRVFRNVNGASALYERDLVVLDKGGIAIEANMFEIKDPSDQATLFTTHRPQYNIPDGVEGDLQTKVASASRVSSPIDVPLIMDSDGHIAIKGSEGVFLDGATIEVQVEHHVLLNSTQGATVLEAGKGIFLDMDRIPVVSSELGLRTGSVQYKICVCMPIGILFRIAIPRVHNGPKISCAHFDSQFDPCEIN